MPFPTDPADMTVPEALRVDTDGGIKPDMAFLALLCEVNQASYHSSIFQRARLSVFCHMSFLLQ